MLSRSTQYLMLLLWLIVTDLKLKFSTLLNFILNIIIVNNHLVLRFESWFQNACKAVMKKLQLQFQNVMHVGGILQSKSKSITSSQLISLFSPHSLILIFPFPNHMLEWIYDTFYFIWGSFFQSLWKHEWVASCTYYLINKIFRCWTWFKEQAGFHFFFHSTIF